MRKCRGRYGAVGREESDPALTRHCRSAVARRAFTTRRVSAEAIVRAHPRAPFRPCRLPSWSQGRSACCYGRTLKARFARKEASSVPRARGLVRARASNVWPFSGDRQRCRDQVASGAVGERQSVCAMTSSAPVPGMWRAGVSVTSRGGSPGSAARHGASPRGGSIGRVDAAPA